MRRKLVPGLAVVYFIAMLVAVTYPGYVPFNEIRPFVFGLPFSLFWQVLWVCGAVLVLTLVYLWERPERLSSPPTGDWDGEDTSGRAPEDKAPGAGA